MKFRKELNNASYASGRVNAKVLDNSAISVKWIFNNEQQLDMHSIYKREQKEHSKFGSY